jgi:hypothetical protein
MVALPTSTVPQAARQPNGAPLSILRTETVLSRFPIHNLTQGREVTIHITQTTAQGTLELRWEVSYNQRYGPPGPLAYKLDTIVIHQILDALPRPLPNVLRVDSLRQIGTLLDVNDSGRQYAHLKRAFHQNASAYIVAYLRYRGRDGLERIINTGFTRYSVIFTGEHLPDGTTADAVYLVLSEPYREVLNHAPVRPLDYTYLKVLTPTAQRFYEIVSYKIFPALKYRRPHATLRYSEYCLLSTQQRHTEAIQVQKQMYKVHRPHVQAGYLTTVAYEATTDAAGQPDWLLHYTPGPKAKAEYAAFMHQPGAEAAALTLSVDADQEDLMATVTHAPPAAPPPAAVASPPPRAGRAAREAPASLASLPAAMPPRPPAAVPEESSPPPADPRQAQAEALVQQFYQRFYGRANVTPGPKELAQARALLAQHGAATAHFFVDFSHQAAGATQYQPQTFMGIAQYLDRALAAYQARATQVAAQRVQREQYQAWEQGAVDQLRAALPPEELAAREAAARARLIAEGKPEYTLQGAVRVAVDTMLAAQAGLPTFEAWRAQQEAGR